MATQPILLARGDIFGTIFSWDFFLEFFRRYPDDPVLFPDGRSKHAPHPSLMGCTLSEDPEDEFVTDWVVRHSERFPLAFYNVKEDRWVWPTNLVISMTNRWRTCPRVQALVRELGIDTAQSSWVEIWHAPIDAEWSVTGRDYNGYEVLTWHIPESKIISEMAMVYRGEPISPHPYTTRLLNEKELTVESLHRELSALVGAANAKEEHVLW